MNLLISVNLICYCKEPIIEGTGVKWPMMIESLSIMESLAWWMTLKTTTTKCNGVTHQSLKKDQLCRKMLEKESRIFVKIKKFLCSGIRSI